MILFLNIFDKGGQIAQNASTLTQPVNPLVCLPAGSVGVFRQLDCYRSTLDCSAFMKKA